jgi:Tetratricopeptide repeat
MFHKNIRTHIPLLRKVRLNSILCSSAVGRLVNQGDPPDASLNNLSNRLADLGRREDALATIEEAVTIHRELATRWPGAYQRELEQSLRNVAWLEQGGDDSDASPQEPGG